jgi:hypothetical protein
MFTDSAIDNIRLIMDVILAIGLIVTSYISVTIKTSVSEIRLEQAKVQAALAQAQTVDRENLTNTQNKTREEFLAKVSALEQAAAVHNAQDELNFRGIRDSLQRIETSILAKQPTSPSVTSTPPG